MTADELAQDVRFGARMLVNHRSFALIAIVSLALATGATAAIFSVINSVLLRPLPFADPERLVQIAATSMVREDLEALRRQSASFASFAEYSIATRHIQTPSGTERVSGVVSDRELFDVLGARALAGRTFRRDDGLVAIISERLWRVRFGADPRVIGTFVNLDGSPFTIVGIMPDEFQFPYGAASVLRSAMAESRVDLWIAEYRPLRGRLSHLVARLKDGVSPGAATGEIAAVEERRAALSGGQRRIERGLAVPYTDAVLGPMRRPLWLLFGAVALVLVAACANIANLSLSLANTRLQEIATRAALGASRARLVRQFLAESLVLAFAGGIGGVFVGRWTSHLLVVFGSQKIPRAHEIAFDWTVFAFLAIVCAAAAVLFGMLPALAAGRVDAGLIAQETSRATAGRSHERVRNALVVAEVALAFVLASGVAAVMFEMERLRGSNLGMQPDNVITLHLGQPMTPGIERQYYDIADRVRRLDNVEAAGFTQVLPLQNWGWNSSSTDFFVKGAPRRGEPTFPIELRFVTPGYFDALGIVLKSGRGFSNSDTEATPRVILINETLARKYFGAQDPVGIEMNRGRIVGVVGDVRQAEIDRPAEPEIYSAVAQNWSQVADLGMTLVVRATARPESVVDAVRARVHEVNRRIAIFNVRTMNDVVSDALWDLNLYRWLIGWFAMVALILSAAGLYGVVSHSVIARRREWAVRLALGSAPSQLAAMVLRRGLVPAVLGIAAGAALVAMLVRVLGIAIPAAANAPIPILSGVALMVFGIALCASWLPARRVARMAPASALKAL